MGTEEANENYGTKNKTMKIIYSEFEKAFINDNPIEKIKSIIKNNEKLAKDDLIILQI
jgi:hypothetical protein